MPASPRRCRIVAARNDAVEVVGDVEDRCVTVGHLRVEGEQIDGVGGVGRMVRSSSTAFLTPRSNARAARP